MPKRVLITGAVVIALVVIASAIFVYTAIFVPTGGPNAAPVAITVQPGDGLSRLAYRLEAAGLIKSRLAFRLYAALFHAPIKIEPGQYALSPALNVPSIIDKLAAGNALKRRVTILPGWTVKRVALELADKNIISVQAFLAAVSADHAADFVSDFDFLADKPASQGLEGYLYPDSYDIAPGASAADIVRLMLKNFANHFNEQAKNIFNTITVASLLEKEVQTRADKQMVAGIIANRLKIGLALQMDSTIAFISGNYSGAFDHGEKTINSPYNTFKYQGLPPGPIGNPSIEDIEAAAQPTPSDYLYYFTAKAGRTVFSKTFQEHEINKAKYLP